MSRHTRAEYSNAGAGSRCKAVAMAFQSATLRNFMGNCFDWAAADAIILPTVGRSVLLRSAVLLR
jgi:hypothetical protein